MNTNDNKHNLLYFQGESMSALYDTLNAWQTQNSKRFLSLSIQPDSCGFACIALTNPSEVVIVAQDYTDFHFQRDHRYYEVLCHKEYAQLRVTH